MKLKYAISMLTKDKRFSFILIFGALLLCIPFIAMQFTSIVNWTLFDFLVAGFLIFGTGSLLELVLRKVKTTRNRLYLFGAITLLFLTVWAELAIGVFGTPFAGY